jgi:uncharacterized Zn-finger protein
MKKTQQVSCNGGKDSQSKHPLIYLKVTDKNQTVCPYCSKTFTLGKNKLSRKIYLEASESTRSVVEL